MKATCRRTGRIAALTAALGLTSGCFSNSPPRVYPDKPDPHAAQRAMELYDANKDGLLDAKELEKAPGLKAAMKLVDSNHDGKVSAAEISARIQAWADSKLGRKIVTCIVTHNGKPLVGATVKFVPESFLGSELKAAEGTTDAHGAARLKVPGSANPGVSPGFYRVEITNEGERIPPRFNSETQLGQEVAVDATGLPNGVATINLKY